ncbi:Short chain dehydrogenase citE [Pseudocercospora fuligena]|uniref:Short chain dehydrogenase citE n=1 Tax=Pseudocercospora fuligena TaxID=685502 RepID=A0A8H6RP73_9PEZI|nr:Short chain dehydrogenase citE [Pseudocercospora fuligena]
MYFKIKVSLKRASYIDLEFCDMAHKATHASNNPFGMRLVPTKHQVTYPYIDPEKAQASDAKVLVTGASKGIGLAIVKSYARAGTSAIALFARSNLDAAAKEVLDAARKAGRKEPRILKLQADIGDSSAVERAMKTVSEEFGYLDVLVNNASRLETWHPMAQTDVEDWWKTWEVNVKGTYLVTRSALPLLLKGKLKTIVTVSSAGALATIPGGSAYQSTKFAQLRFHDFLMAEYGQQGLIAFAVHPCSAPTETALNMPESMHFILTETPELAADTITWMTRTRREWYFYHSPEC